MQILWQSHDIWLAASYGCEGCTLKKTDESQIKAFEMKGLRQILRVSCTARKTNEWILEKAGVTRTLLASIKTKKLHYFSHIMRQYCFQKNIIQRTLSGKRKRGKPKTWLGNIIQWTDMDIERVLGATDNRSQWRMTIDGVVNPQIEDD